MYSFVSLVVPVDREVRKTYVEDRSTRRETHVGMCNTPGLADRVTIFQYNLRTGNGIGR